MQYLMLIYVNEKEPVPEQTLAQYGVLRKELIEGGKLLGANRLQSVTTATTVRVRGGKTAVTDGPFAETREQLGGYMLIDVKDLDEAIAIAARIPLARTSTVEVRPVREGPPK